MSPLGRGAIRTLNSAEASYANTYSKVGRTCNLRDLAGAVGHLQRLG